MKFMVADLEGVGYAILTIHQQIVLICFHDLVSIQYTVKLVFPHLHTQQIPKDFLYKGLMVKIGEKGDRSGLERKLPEKRGDG